MRITLILISLILSTSLLAQKKNLNYYLPDISYDKNIPTPEEYLGYQVGEWHVSHDQLVGYMKMLAEKSDRITIETYARSYENRPLLLLTITSLENHKNIEKIRTNHVKLSTEKDGGKLKIADMPSILYQGYSVHGNEASGGNAALLYAYYLAAGQGSEIEKTLNEVVVLLDPCFNPDGFQRFQGWVNSHKSYNLVADGSSRELNEVWPGGRTNHYWFDLNRDWLLLAHPESRGRIRNFQKWKPNILTDHHEMGSNSTFFFQPGIPTRTNPNTPEQNQELTEAIGAYHAKELDKIGSLYYSKESFDDFYYGKGSTYPDVQACIGILFEQASARGHLHESVNGDLSFPFAIRNQLKTSLSTLSAGQGLRKELLNFQQTFYSSAMKEAASDSKKAYVFSEPHDQARLQHFIEILLQHNIEVYKNKNDINTQGKTFSKNNSYLVPTNQAQYRLIKGIFETQTSFKDSLFYDVSAWTLPLAFNLNYSAVTSKIGSLGQPLTLDDLSKNNFQPQKSDYAYLFEWNEYYAPKALYHLLKNGLTAKVANKTFTAETKTGSKDFGLGTIMISVQNQNKTPEEILSLISEATEIAGIQMYSAISGFTPDGVDLGSPGFSNIVQPKVLLVVGDGVTSYDAGEVWHLLDQRYQMPTTLVDVTDFSSVNLEDYTVVVMVNGSYSRLGNGAEKLKGWVEEGGTIVAMRGAVNWVNGQSLANISFKKDNGKNKTESRPYSSLSADRGATVVGGSIFEVKLDLTHPLAYGYDREVLPVFRKGTTFFELPKNQYAAPAIYTQNPLLSGYISTDNLDKIGNTAAVVVCRSGSGRVICMSDNPNFRAFWYGTNKLFANAIFFGNTIDRGATESPAAKKD
jgi:zinc carboxypeptidase